VSLTTIVMFALGYLAVLIVVLCMLVCAKRADERVQEEHDALVRSMTHDVQAPERPEQHRDRTLSLIRHAG